jgi:uncharacterized protein (DUF111 family)
MVGGASGDMLLGALVDAGVSLDALLAELKKVPFGGYTLYASKVRRAAVDATLVTVEITHDEARSGTFDGFKAAVRGSSLPDGDKQAALKIFDTLSAAEQAAHRSGASHLHELGTVDTLVDVVGAVVGLRLLGIERLHASPFPLGAGASKSSHGASAATAPATQQVYLSKGVPVRAAGVQFPPGEAVTPTGAAIIATLADFGPVSLLTQRVGYGAGRRDPKDYPNVLGLWVGETVDVHPSPHPSPSRGEGVKSSPSPSTGDPSAGSGRRGGGEDAKAPPNVILSPGLGRDSESSSRGHALPNELDSSPGFRRGQNDIPRRGGLTLLETNIDDMSGELFGFVQERLFAAGALDVWFAPIQMKKNRPGVLLSAIVPADAADRAAGVILRETSTLGVRTRPVERYEAEREVVQVETSLGRLPVKVKRLAGAVLDASPEYEACREVALRTGLPLQEVMRRAQAEALAWLAGHTK